MAGELRTVIIGIVVVLAGLGLLGFRMATTVSAEELCNDWDTMVGTFDSYDKGDVIKVIDVINDIRFVPDHIMTGEPVNWTYITLKSVDLKIDNVLNMAFDFSKLWGMMVFNGDLTKDFKEGDRVQIEMKVVEYEIMGMTTEIPEWYEDLMDAVYDEDIGATSYMDLDLADKNDITHANYIIEITSVVIIVVGIVILTVGARKYIKAKKMRQDSTRFYRDYYRGGSGSPPSPPPPSDYPPRDSGRDRDYYPPPPPPPPPPPSY